MEKYICYYEKDSICSNSKCPMNSSYCPIPDKPGVCKYEKRNNKLSSKNFVQWIAISIVIMTIVIGVGSFIGWVYKNNTQYTEYKYSLLELNNGVYGTLTQVASSVPAQNYSMITLCCEGNIYTFKGTVEIQYTASADPYVKIHDYNITNGDHVWVYVPSGTIEFQKGVGVG